MALKLSNNSHFKKTLSDMGLTAKKLHFNIKNPLENQSMCNSWACWSHATPTEPSRMYHYILPHSYIWSPIRFSFSILLKSKKWPDVIPHIDYVNIACSNSPTDKETESRGREVTYATQQVMGRSPQTVGPRVQNRCLLTSSLKKLTENCQQAHYRYKNLTAEVL